MPVMREFPKRLINKNSLPTLKKYSILVTGLECEGGLLVVVESGGSPHYFNYVLALSKAAKRLEREVFVIEIDSRRDSRFWYPFRSAKFRSLDTTVSLCAEWREQLSEIGVRYLGRHDVSASKHTGTYLRQAERLCKDLNAIDDIPKALEIDPELARSVHSLMLQEVARGYHLARRKIRKRAAQVSVHYFQTSHVIQEVMNEFPLIGQLVVPNGRAPVQAAALEAARLNHRVSLTYEHGSKRGESVFLASWRYHDRLRFQQALRDAEPEGFLDIGETVLTEWQTDLKLNPYLFEPTKEGLEFQPNPLSELPLAVYFVSSADEFVSSGPNWPIWRWSDQWEALTEVIPYLQQSGYRVIIKEHPNLLNKSWREAACQTMRSRSYGVTNVGALDKISAVDLIEQANLILTWGSTVGIEGIARGKPVWLLSHCHYDFTVDVRMWPRVGFPEPATLEYSPNSDSALIWYGFANSLGTPLKVLDPDLSPDDILRADFLELRANRIDRIMQMVLLPWVLFATPRITQKISRKFLGRRASDSIIRRALGSGFLLKGCPQVRTERWF